MKILFVAQAFQDKSGGSSISEGSVARFLADQAETTIICRKDELEGSFVKRYGLEKTIPYSPKDLLKMKFDPKHWLNQVIRGQDVCHLNGHWRWEDRLIAEACLKQKVPYLIQPRGMLWLGHRNVFAKKVYNLLWGQSFVQGASQIIALSDFEKQQLRPYSLPQDRISILPNGVWDSKWDSIPEKSLEAPEHPHFLYFGRLEARKNLLFLIDAYQRYLIRGGKHQLSLMGPVEKGYDEVLRKKIDRLQLSRWIAIRKPVYGAEKWKSLSQATAVVYPSFGEPFGRVPFEAVLCGTPVIVPRESGSGEYLRPFFPELVFDRFDKIKLYESLMASDTRSSEFRAKANEARNWVKQELDWQKVGKRLIAIYRNLIDSQNRMAA